LKNQKSSRYSIDKFFSIRAITGFTISKNDKKIFFITNTTGKPQIWSISIDGGWANQISTWTESVKQIHLSKKTNEIIFLSDTTGNENNQIYKMPDKGGDVTCLTEGFEDSQCFFSGFNKKGNKFLFSTNKRLKYNFDSYIKNINTNENIFIKGFEDKIPTQPESWSNDERYITYLKFYSNMNIDILLYDSKNDTMENITEHEGGTDVFNAGTEFDKDNKGFYYVSDKGREFKGLKYYDIKKKKSHWVLQEKWDVTNYKFSSDYKYLLWSVNENGSNNPKLKNLKTGKIQKLKLPKANYSSLKFTHDNKKLVCLCDGPLNPNDLFVYDLKKQTAKQITDAFVGGVSKHGLTNPKDVFYKSFDGLKIHALFYIPKELKKDGKNPAIVWPHGGPEHQEIHNFSRYVQVFVNAGYIVIAPNFRGSTGYGKTFQKKIYKDWGGAEFKDVLGSVDYLKKSGYVDSKKIAVVGGSFGGFMCLTCITKSPEIWKCAVDIFGPSDLFTFVNSVPEHWKKGTDDLVGNPVNDKEMLYERSPINFVDKISCPLLVVQGKHDPRVVEAESEQIVKKLRAQKKPVEYILLEDEGHGFSKVSNQIKVFDAKIKFLDKYLK